MKFLILSTLLLLIVSKSDDLDVGYKFLMYATQKCGKGKVSVADIGNGNLVYQYNISEKELATYRMTSNKRFNDSKPGLRPDSLNPADCSETQEKSCVGRGDTHYWCNYPDHRCMSPYVSQTGGNYTNIKVTSSNDPWVFEGWLDNDSNESQTMHYTRSEKTTTSYQWSFTNTIEIGDTYSLDVKVPVAMDATESTSFTWTSTESTSTTKTTEKSWEISQNVVVAPHSTIKATTIIKKAKYAGNYHANMKLPFYAKLWCVDEVSGHREWFVRAEKFLNCNPCNVGGSSVGWQGVDMQTSIKQCPLYSRDC
jgi:hypothetical protein